MRAWRRRYVMTSSAKVWGVYCSLQRRREKKNSAVKGVKYSELLNKLCPCWVLRALSLSEPSYRRIHPLYRFTFAFIIFFGSHFTAEGRPETAVWPWRTLISSNTSLSEIQVQNTLILSATQASWLTPRALLTILRSVFSLNPFMWRISAVLEWMTWWKRGVGWTDPTTCSPFLSAAILLHLKHFTFILVNAE